MPALVHTNIALQGGFAKVSESVSEDASGLVTVQMEFVCRASNSARLSRLFYSDAPPPIFPDALNASDLITRRLYMVNRSVEQSNGLTYVQAEYAAGFANKRSNHLRFVDRESERSFQFISEPFEIRRVNPNAPDNIITAGNLTNRFAYSWIPFVVTFEYVEIGSIAAYTPTQPPRSELFSISAFSSNFYVPAPELGWSAIKNISYEKSWFEDLFINRTVREDRKPVYVTPTVKTIQHRFYL
jgi:hypothetical protein